MRVVAGTSRGTPLRAPKGSDVRPTTDRIKEAMFAPLQFGLSGAAVLDVFGGTGALGLEAASRGAARVVIIEKARAAQSAIRANIAACGSPGSVELLTMPWTRAFARLETQGLRFDYVFVDPPYRSGQYAPVLAALRSHHLLAEGALVVLESDTELPHEETGYTWERTRRYGSIYVTWMGPAEREERPAGSGPC